MNHSFNFNNYLELHDKELNSDEGAYIFTLETLGAEQRNTILRATTTFVFLFKFGLEKLTM